MRHDDYDEKLIVMQHQNDLERTETGVGVYGEFSWHFNEKFRLLAGLRGDYNSKYSYFVTPRLHTKYSITDNFIARASVGKGHRMPNVIAENTYLLASSRDIVIAPDLAMEVAWNYGANLTRYFTLGKNKYTMQLDYFRTDFVNQNVVDVDSDFSRISFYNLNGESFSNNYQFEVNAAPFRGMEVTMAYRYSDVKTTYGDKLLSRPLTSEYKGLLTASYQTALKKWQFDGTLLLNGKGRIPSTASKPEQYQLNETFEPYTVTNVQITKYFRKWNVYIGAENLFDFVQKNPIIAANDPFGPYFDASMNWGPVDGRKVYVGVRYSIKGGD